MRSCHKRRRRSMLRLLCLYLTSPNAVVTAMSWTCSLGSVPAETIPIYPPAREEDGRWRNLRATSENDAIVVPELNDDIEHQHQMMRKAYNHDEDINSSANSYPGIFDMATTFGTELSNETEVVPDESNISYPYIEARRCICATGYAFSPDDKYYCTTPSNHCSVWRSRYRLDYRVTCYEYKDWKIGFARNVWYYLCFALLLLILYPIFSRPGQHAVRYLLSKCFPRMNPWITEQILQTEIQARNRIRDQFENALRQKRRTEGWVSGYTLKTKRYVASGEASGLKTNAQCDSERECKTNDDKLNPEEDEGARETASQGDQSISNSDDYMCTICLLAVEDGDKIADLPCGHLYHAECLGEWILKKNSCPLCSDENIANEIRSFETEDERDSTDESASEGRLNRWRRQVRESFVDIATGRSRRGLRNHHNLMMLEE